MQRETEIFGGYRGFVISKVTEITEQSDIRDEMFDWVKAMMRVGDARIRYQIGATPILTHTIDDAKKYIDRVMQQETEIYDDGLDYIDTSPAHYFNLSYCTNPTVKCSECCYKNYGRDCNNNKIV